MKGLEENIFKGCIKGKAKFTASTFVKFLITGMIALSLTACGGGGGGSSSSGGATGSVNQIIDKDIINNNSNFGYTGLKVSNGSNVTFSNGKNINISGIYGLTGILTTGNSKVTNDGTIRVLSKYLHDDGSMPEDKLIQSISKGIYVTDKSTGINNGTIELKGSAAGILAYGSGSTGINKGIIKILGDRGATWEEAPAMGMASAYGGKAVNENLITGSDYGQMGMFGYQSELINKGTIQLSENDSYGMVVQEGTIENIGKIILSHGTGKDPNYTYSTTNEAIEVETGKGINKGTIEIKNDYIYENYNYPTKDLDDYIDIGMYGSEGAELINETTGVIKISGSSAGMMVDGEYRGTNSAVNKGIIEVISNRIPVDSDDLLPSIGIAVEDGGKIENSGSIKGNGASILGMASMSNNGVQNRVTNNGIIELSGKDLHGMQSLMGNGNLINNNMIKLTGSGMYGMQGTGNVTNNEAIHLTTTENNPNYNWTIGMDIWEATGVNGNNGKIIIENRVNCNAVGVLIEDGGTFENRGLIEINGGYGAGVRVETMPGTQKRVTAVNNGVITVTGNSYGLHGMSAEGEESSIINYGTINVNANNSWGMAAFNGAQAANYGTINVGDTAAGGMLADGAGSTIYNDISGIINISASNTSAKKIHAMNGGGILNSGKINTNAAVEVGTSGTYVIGTDENGNYGKLSAKNVNFDGNVVAEARMARGNYKRELILENAVEAENLKLGENANFKTDSVLYSASGEKDVFGNLDVKLSRNNNVSDFADKKFTGVSSIFDSYINNENEYNKLSLKEKEAVDTIFDNSASENSLRNAVNQAVGTEYLNIQKQIFDIKNNFKEYDDSVISTLDNYDFNFKFIGEYSETSSKNGITGYENKMTGFDGAMKLSDNLYGVLGYGYSDIDYDGNSDGKIQTVHTGIYKDLSADGYKLRMGMYGEYNFHENNRAVFDKRAESDFNSYLAGVSGEVSRKYGDDLYIKPSLSLDIAYGNIGSFDEEKADGFNLNVEEQDYTSVLPKAEVILGKDFVNSKLFVSAEYSYELGDMDKDMTVELLHKKADVKNNEMEHGQFDVSVGGSLDINNLSLSAEIGKEFGRRDREYVKAGFSYKF